MDAKTSNSLFPQNNEILQQLDSVIGSETFSSSQRLRDLLSYIVNETLAGETENLLGKNIQTDVLSKYSTSANSSSSTVRVEIGRLRRRLHQYYGTEGRLDRVHIEIPKGVYKAKFNYQDSVQSESIIRNKFVPLQISGSQLLIIALAFIFLIAGAWFLTQRFSSEILVEKPVVAVLPLQQIGSKFPIHDISDGLVADLITDLSGAKNLFVISLASSSKFKGAEVNLDQAGQKLDATHLVHGTIQYSGEKFRINLGLHSVSDNRQVWAQRFDYSDEDILQAQNDMAQKVSKALSVNLKPDTHDAKKENLANSKVQALYLQTKDLMNPPTDRTRIEVAKSMLRRVIEIAPKSSLGYAGLSYAIATGAWFRPSEQQEEALEEVEALAKKALEINPSASRAFVGLCIVALIRRKFELADEQCEKGIKAQPNDDLSRAFKGLISVYRGRSEEGANSLEIAINLNPLEPRTGYLNMLGQAYFHGGRYEESLKAFQRSIREGGPVGPHIIYYLASNYTALGNLDEAKNTFKQLDRFGKGFSFEEWLRRSFQDPREVDRVTNLLSIIQS